MTPSNHDRHELRAELRRLGLVIRTRRQQLGMSIQQLAEGSMVSPAMVSLVERGLASPSLATLSAMAATLDTSMGGLFGAAEQMRNHPDEDHAPSNENHSTASGPASTPVSTNTTGEPGNPLPA